MSNAKQPSTSLADARQKQFWGHPVGLWTLFTTEMWERFCYYGMRALLVLYLISTLTDSNPGFGWSEKSANQLYGWFTGLVYLFPLLGGYLADRFLGQHRSVLLGGALMAAGEFCLFYTEYFRQNAISTIAPDSAPAAFWCFMFGLFLITLGNGFFKPCISVMVGELYEKNDPRRDDAFNLFYMGINVGAFFSPFVAGSIGETIGWHWGFLTACIGMCFGLTTYALLRSKYLGPIGLLKKEKNADETAQVAVDANSDSTDAATVQAADAPKPVEKRRLTKTEIDRVAVILTLTFFCVAFWSVFEQAGTSLNIFAKKETNRQVPQVVGRSLPGFLANQDEIDAKIATNELRTDLLELKTALEALGAQDVSRRFDDNVFVADFDYAVFQSACDDADAQIDATEEAKKADSLADEAAKIADAQAAFDAALADVASSFEMAQTALNKANRARRNAGQEELQTNLVDFATLLREGQAAQEEIAAAVDALYAEKIDGLENATDEELAALKAGLDKDVRKKRQNDFAANEAKKIDKANAIYTFPTTWYQSVNPLMVVICAPLFNLLWGFLRRRKLEPSTPVKFGIGLVLLSFAFLFMIGGALHSSKTDGNAGAYWLVCTYVLCTWGELCLSPVGLSMVSRLAPARYASLLMGVWFLSSAVAGYLSGYLASALGSSDGSGGSVSFCFGSQGGLADFFLILTLAPLVAGIIVFLLAPKLRKMMHENE